MALTASPALLAPGRIMSRKGIAAPGPPDPDPRPHRRNIADGHFAVSQGVDDIALSFVQRAADVITARETFAWQSPSSPRSKSPPPPSMNSTPSSPPPDAVTVARGDLGVELLARAGPDRAAPHRPHRPRPRQAGHRCNPHAGIFHDRSARPHPRRSQPTSQPLSDQGL